MNQPKPKPKGALIAALVFLLLGIGGCGFAAFKTVPYIQDVVDFVTDLDQVARTRPMGEPITFTATGTEGIALLSGEAVCEGEGSGGPVTFDPYESFGPGTTVELGGVNIEGYILFDTETDGEYTITCGAGGFGSYVVTTAPSFLVEGAPGVAAGIGAGLFGAFCVLVAVILFIVGLVQRSSWKKRNQGPPAGQFQQPPAPGQGAPPAPGQNAWGSPQPPPPAMPPGQPQPGQGQPGAPTPPPAPPTQQQPPAAPGTPPPFTGGTQPPQAPGGDTPPPPPPPQ